MPRRITAIKAIILHTFKVEVGFRILSATSVDPATAWPDPGCPPRVRQRSAPKGEDKAH